jgi:predicted ester cyclase
MHTEDSVFCNHTSGGEAVGREAIRRIVSGVFQTFPDIRFEPRRLYVRDDLVVQEWTASATHRHPVKYKDVALAPTGRTVRWNGVDVIPMREGRVARKDVYAGSMSYLRQLGASL